MRMRKIMIAMVLGVVAGVVASFAERADSAITGGNATPLGYINTYTWLLVSATIFGPVGAVITTEVQAFIGLITAANPLSWLWPFVNFVFAVVVGTVSVVLSKLHPKMKLHTRVLFLSLSCALLDIPMTYVVIVMVLGLPFNFYLLALPIYVTLQLVPSTLISYAILRGILRTQIIGVAQGVKDY